MGSAIEPVQRFFGNFFPKVDDYIRHPLSLFNVGDIDEREGAILDGVVFGKYTLSDFAYGYLDDGGVFTDDTTDVNDAGAADVALMPAVEQVNDAFYFGSADRFTGIKLTLSTAGVGDTIVWEYYNGSAWTNLATSHHLQDDSTGLTAGTSAYYITWTVPRNWTTTTVNSASAYWVRLRVTAASFTTVPVGTQARCMKLTAGVGVAFPANGIVTGASWAADYVSGSTDDTVVQIVNVTKGTSTYFTMTKAVVAGHADVENPNGLSFDKGDVMIIQCTQGDADEFANVSLVLEYKA